MRCPRCGADGEVTRGRSREVTVRTVAGVGEAVPVVGCPAGHAEPPAVADAVVDRCREAVPRAARGRLPRRHDRCGRCREPLSMPVRRTERPVTVDGIAGLPVTTLRFDLPTTRCSGCGLDQVPTRSADDLDAVARALFTAHPQPTVGA
jgi:hypothetical protein